MYRSDTSKVWWEILHGYCCKFLIEYNSEKICKSTNIWLWHSNERMYSGTVFLTHCHCVQSPCTYSGL